MGCCMHIKPPGLTKLDVEKTQKLMLICAKALFSFSPKTKYEPSLPLYCVEEKRTYVPVDDADVEKAAREAGVPLSHEALN